MNLTQQRAWDRRAQKSILARAPSFTFYFRPSSKQNKLLQLVRAFLPFYSVSVVLTCSPENLFRLFFFLKQHKKIINQRGILTRLWEKKEAHRHREEREKNVKCMQDKYFLVLPSLLISFPFPHNFHSRSH